MFQITPLAISKVFLQITEDKQISSHITSSYIIFCNRESCLLYFKNSFQTSDLTPINNGKWYCGYRRHNNSVVWCSEFNSRIYISKEYQGWLLSSQKVTLSRVTLGGLREEPVMWFLGPKPARPLLGSKGETPPWQPAGVEVSVSPASMHEFCWFTGELKRLAFTLLSKLNCHITSEENRSEHMEAFSFSDWRRISACGEQRFEGGGFKQSMKQHVTAKWGRVGPCWVEWWRNTSISPLVFLVLRKWKEVRHAYIYTTGN